MHLLVSAVVLLAYAVYCALAVSPAEIRLEPRGDSGARYKPVFATTAAVLDVPVGQQVSVSQLFSSGLAPTLAANVDSATLVYRPSPATPSTVWFVRNDTAAGIQAVNGTFTHREVLDGRVFVQAAAQVSSASSSVEIKAFFGGSPDLAATLALQVALHQLVIVNNGVVNATAATNVYISEEMLKVTDYDAPTDKIVYKITSLAAAGRLIGRIGDTLILREEFTQADIERHSLIYASDPSAAGVQVTFELAVYNDDFPAYARRLNLTLNVSAPVPEDEDPVMVTTMIAASAGGIAFVLVVGTTVAVVRHPRWRQFMASRSYKSNGMRQAVNVNDPTANATAAAAHYVHAEQFRQSMEMVALGSGGYAGGAQRASLVAARLSEQNLLSGVVDVSDDGARGNRAEFSGLDDERRVYESA